jgi:hypothetical protein
VRSGIHKHPWTFYRKITYACHNVEVGRCGRDRMPITCIKGQTRVLLSKGGADHPVTNF